MASTSVSSIQKNFKYDVFLSFRGEDTRKNFVDHLYHALKQKGIDTYRDDEKIKKGEMISEQLLRSIEDSRFYIIVFSKNYASSSWCLDELTKITECQEMKEHTAYPVFYDVEPTEVRKQSGAVGQAFAKHKDAESAGKWTKALRCAADLAGWELKNTSDGHEAMLIQKIVKEISLELRYIDLSDDPKLIGMKERVQDAISYLKIDIDDVRMIGIKGMGGGGKTTLGKAIFDQISDLYEGSTFVENVRESTKVLGLKALQKQVLSDVLNDPIVDVSGVPDLKRMMQKKMKCRKVLVVLDDVDHIDQLQALAGETNWFKPGSRVIITTREEQVLVAHGVPRNLILDVNLLSHEEASCLFNRYAFGREIPDHGFEKLSYEFIRYAAGLPLTIKVLGSLLCGRDELEWEDELKRLKTIPLMETLRILELSYNSLEEDRKEIFLDVACILKGWEKEIAIRALESLGFYARSGLKVLEQKSLLTVSENGRLSMHDHIEEMGKNIVRRLHPNEPHKHSRLWIEEEVNDILVEDKGTEATRYISVLGVNLVIVMKGLRKMKELRFFRYKVGKYMCNNNHNYDDIGEDSLYLPDGLQYLSWDCYPFTYLPKSFQANNLVGLEMCNSKIKQLWDGGERKDLKKLRFVDLRFCAVRTLDIGMFLNLERLNLHKCVHLEELRLPVESFKLKFLHLCDCKLKTLDLAWANNLEMLSVELCWDFVELRMPVKSSRLNFFYLCNCKLKTLDLAHAQSLNTLHVANCENLVELHMPSGSLQLKDLSLKNCKLKILNLVCALNLMKLDVRECEDLVELHLPANVKIEFLNLRRSKVKTLDLAGALYLEELTIEKCDFMVEIHMPVESSMLEYLYLQCSKLKTLNLQWALNLENLDLIECKELEDLNMPVECFNLDYLFVCNSKLKTLDLAGALNLIKLQIEKCHNLVELHMPIEILMLKDLSLQCPKLKTLNLTSSLNLESLNLEECVDLRTLYLGPSPNLQHFVLKNCYNPVEIHTPIGWLNDHFPIKTTSCCLWYPLSINQGSPMVLTELHLTTTSLCFECQSHDLRFECIYKEPLPSLVGNPEKLIFYHVCTGTNLASFLENSRGLQYVRKLTLEGSSIPPVLKALGQLPEDFGRLKSLEELHLTDCTSLRDIPHSIRDMKHLKCFHLTDCPNLVGLSETICGLLSLRKLTLEGSIPEVPKDLDQLECLEELSLLSTKIERLPDSICMLKHLKSLELKSCWDLKQLPEDLGRLECLEELHLTDCTSLREIPNNICDMKRLKCLHLTKCLLLEKLPVDLGRLECLEELHLTDCIFLRDIPSSICEMKHLKCLHLSYCLLVEKLPEEIGRLKCLKELNIECTGISHLPQSIFQLKGLLLIGSTWRLESYGITSMTENSKYSASCHI